MTDKFKQLTGKNPKDFEPVAYSLINDSDTELFKELVEKDDFLFDFVKQNVINRLEKAVNHNNYLNLLNFLKFYSPSYEDFIVGSLAKYADEDLTDRMLDIFENGNENEKTYCAKFFSLVKDTLALEYLHKYAFCDNSDLSANCACALASFGDKEIYNEAAEKLNSNDEFEKLKAVEFLVSYGDKNALNIIIEALKNSPLAENMAVCIPYLVPLKQMPHDIRLYVLNLITDGLGEVSALSQVFDFELYDVFNGLINGEFSPAAQTVLLNAREKFNTLTENDEYLYDESKEVKQEISDIKSLLCEVKNLSADEELHPQSPFVFTALELTSNIQKVRTLLDCDNQTVIVKALEVLKRLNAITSEDKNKALENVSNNDLINVITAI